MNNQSNEEQRTDQRQARRTLWKVLGLSFLGGIGGGAAVIKHPDERIAATTQKWAAWSGAFLSIAIGIDIVVRIVILKTNFPVEICLIWMINLFVVCIGQIRNGVPAVAAAGRFNWKTSALLLGEIALGVPAILWWMGDIRSWQAYLGGVALAGGAGFVTLLIMRGIYRRWERRTLGPDE